MLKYYAVATGLKMFSSGNLARNFYRFLGNAKNDFSKVTKIPESYYFRSKGYLGLMTDRNLLKPNLKFLEIGTGWSHWEALVLRNQIPCTGTLYDVWDNRSLARLRAYTNLLIDPSVRVRLGINNNDTIELMRRCSNSSSLEEIYDILGFDYVVDPRGNIDELAGGDFELIVSSDVAEHFFSEDISKILTNLKKALRPSGHCYMQIVLTDHLGIYDKSIHPKQYLAFSKKHYDNWLRNGVQYINCVQVPEWREAFFAAGFSIVEERVTGRCNLEQIKIHKDWDAFSAQDLEITVVQFLLQ